MALYFFVLKHGDLTVPDRDGEELPDEAAARVYANAIIRDLMRNREFNTRLWRVEVLDENLAPCFDVHFSEVDETIGHLPPNLQEIIVTISRRAAELHETMKTMRATLTDAKNSLAKADRFLKPGNVPRQH